MTKFIHELADVKSDSIGDGTQIWQFAVILKGARIGHDCNINCHTFIENDVELGNYVTVKSGTYIWDNTKIEDYVFLGPNVVFTNDLRPRSKRKVEFPRTLIKKGASLGANTIILAGVTVGEYAMTGIGSVVTRDIPNYALAYGNPARVMGWVDKEGNKLTKDLDSIWVSKNGERFKEINGGLVKL